MHRLSENKQKIWQELLTYVDKNPPKNIYDKWFYIFLMPSRLWESTWLLDKMKVPGRVLDIGCGNCSHMVYLAKRGFKYVGIDPKFGIDNHLEIYLDYLKNYLPPEVYTNIDIRAERAETFKPKNGEIFDYIMSCSVIEHIELDVLEKGAEPYPSDSFIIRQGIKNVMQHLKKGGLMLHAIDKSFSFSQCFRETILGAEQQPETTTEIDGFKPIYNNLQEYIELNPDRWAIDFPEFTHIPYGLEFKKLGKEGINYFNKYTDEMWYENPREGIWQQWNKNLPSEERINHFEINRLSIKELLQQIEMNVEMLIETELKVGCEFRWKQSRNEIITSLKNGEKIDMAIFTKTNDKLKLVDGAHRLYYLAKIFGQNQEILFILLK